MCMSPTNSENIIFPMASQLRKYLKFSYTVHKDDPWKANWIWLSFSSSNIML